jgi:hypothetical protein
VALAGQIAAINTKIMAEKGIVIDKKQLAADWLKVSGSRVQDELLWIFINRSAEGFEWMLDLTEGCLDVGVYVDIKALCSMNTWELTTFSKEGQRKIHKFRRRYVSLRDT